MIDIHAHILPGIDDGAEVNEFDLIFNGIFSEDDYS